jgi:radical SAM protein with 4Fe4S-binding SPASM domain
MIGYARSKGLGTTLSTNLSVELDDAHIDGLVQSGLEFVCLSVDGATQDTYARYRRKGRLDLVLHNMRRLVERRRALGSRTPVIEWQFIPMKHNEHEVDAARALAAQIGVDRFRCIPVGLPFDSPEPERLEREWFPVTITNGRVKEQEIASNAQSKSACHFLYRYLVVNPDGRTSPCCVVYGERNDFGDILGGDVEALWNNARYRSARSHYRRDGKVEVPTVCDRCNLFEKRARSPVRADAAPRTTH